MSPQIVGWTPLQSSGVDGLFVIGDAHGQFDKICKLLRAAGLVNDKLHWSGGASTLWFTGDFCDRGPSGINVIDLVMRLQREAREGGGNVGALLGNHEILLLGARQFPAHRAPFGSTYYEVWSFNGGREGDREGLTDEHIAWLSALPAMAEEEELLLIHCDSTFYRRYGDTVSTVNGRVRSILTGHDLRAWDELLETYFEREAFVDGAAGIQAARAMLDTYGARAIVHGHTPIPYMTRQDPTGVTEPYVYADGLCIDIDGGMYLGGPGFVVQLTGAALQDATSLAIEPY